MQESEEDAFAADERLADCVRELGRLSQGCRKVGWKEAREDYRRALADLEEEFPLPAELIGELDRPLEAFVGGDEHVNVLVASQPDRVFKVTAHDQFGVVPFFDPADVSGDGRFILARGNDDPFLYLRRWQLLNEVGDYQTRLEGFLAPERENWLPRICVSQPLIPGEPPSQEEISASLRAYGYQEVSSGSYFGIESGILLSDAFPRNVRIKNQAPALFDVVASEPKGTLLNWIRARCRE